MVFEHDLKLVCSFQCWIGINVECMVSIHHLYNVIKEPTHLVSSLLYLSHITLVRFDYVNVNLLSTIMSQIWRFLSVETKKVTKLTNKCDIKSARCQYCRYLVGITIWENLCMPESSSHYLGQYLPSNTLILGRFCLDMKVVGWYMAWSVIKKHKYPHIPIPYKYQNLFNSHYV